MRLMQTQKHGIEVGRNKILRYFCFLSTDKGLSCEHSALFYQLTKVSTRSNCLDILFQPSVDNG